MRRVLAPDGATEHDAPKLHALLCVHWGALMQRMKFCMKSFSITIENWRFFRKMKKVYSVELAEQMGVEE